MKRRLLTGRLLRLWRGRVEPPPPEWSSHLYLGAPAACRFVAENTLAVLCGESVEARHRLELLDGEGRPQRLVEVSSRRQFVCLDPGPEGPDLGTLRYSVQVDAARLGPGATALLRAVPVPGRGCVQYRFGGEPAWRSAVEVATTVAGGGWRRAPRRSFPLPMGEGPPQVLYLLNPAAERAEITVLAAGGRGAGAGPVATLRVPAQGVRRLALEGLEGVLTLRSRQTAWRALLLAA